jgi:hypothetical protein
MRSAGIGSAFMTRCGHKPVRYPAPHQCFAMEVMEETSSAAASIQNDSGPAQGQADPGAGRLEVRQTACRCVCWLVS